MGSIRILYISDRAETVPVMWQGEFWLTYLARELGGPLIQCRTRYWPLDDVLYLKHPSGFINRLATAVARVSLDKPIFGHALIVGVDPHRSSLASVSDQAAGHISQAWEHTR